LVDAILDIYILFHFANQVSRQPIFHPNVNLTVPPHKIMRDASRFFHYISGSDVAFMNGSHFLPKLYVGTNDLWNLFKGRHQNDTFGTFEKRFLVHTKARKDNRDPNCTQSAA
jgi:hypothetical protein